jgi:hypothetical protein
MNQLNNQTPKSLDKKTINSNKSQTPSSVKHSLVKKSIQFNSDPKPKTDIRPKTSMRQFNLPTGSTPSSTRTFTIPTVIKV